jgi:hypothetical protein
VKWLSWFRSEKSRPIAKSTPCPPNPDANELKILFERLEQLEKSLSKLNQQQKAPIHIENLHVDKATFDGLTFRLDQLDIQELSGSLNIGNNFQEQKEKKKSEPQSTTSGYSVRL